MCWTYLDRIFLLFSLLFTAELYLSHPFNFSCKYKKPLIVHFKNGASDWTDPMKWTKASLLKMYSDWSVLSGTSEDIVRKGGNGDTETSFYEYLDMMHEKEHNEEPM